VIGGIIAYFLNQLKFEVSQSIVLDINHMIGVIIITLNIGVVINTGIFFKEIPYENRMMFTELKAAEKRQNKKEDKVKQIVEVYTLSGYSECKPAITSLCSDFFTRVNSQACERRHHCSFPDFPYALHPGCNVHYTDFDCRSLIVC
jgi:hypothetical protein